MGHWQDTEQEKIWGTDKTLRRKDMEHTQDTEQVTPHYHNKASTVRNVGRSYSAQV